MDDAQRTRSTRLVFGGVAFGSVSLFAAFTVAPLLARDITGSRAWSGVPGAMSVAGTAAGVALMSPLMARRGRAAGLRLGYAIGAVGAAGAVFAAGAGSFPALVVTMALVGIGHASNQVARFAGADMHPPHRRAAVLGWVVWASTIGAALGPLLTRPLRPLATAVDLPPEAAGFLVGVAFYLLALGSVSLLRAGPAPVAADDTPAGVAGDIISLGQMMKMRTVRTAFAALLAAQAGMVLVMTITPVHVRDAGHGLGVVGIVMSCHFVGMYALAPVAGHLVHRFGASPLIAGGMATLAVGATGAGFTDGSHGAMVAVWLFLLGLGWCAAFVAGSSLLTQGLSYRDRVHVQGRIDSVSWTASACASATSGLLLEHFGYLDVSLAGAAVALGALFVLPRRRGTAKPAVGSSVA